MDSVFGELSITPRFNVLTTCPIGCKFNLEAMQSIIALVRPTFFTAKLFHIWSNSWAGAEDQSNWLLVVTNKWVHAKCTGGSCLLVFLLGAICNYDSVP